MSAVHWPDHLLTLDEWDALADDVSYRRAELVEGVLHVAPSPALRHQLAQFALMKQLDLARGESMLITDDLDVVLAATFPPTVRQPDVLVVRRSVLDAPAARLSASHVLLAVEIVSPGSRRIDRIDKAADYARAGIPHYWILDLERPAALDVLRLAGGRYEPVMSRATGRVAIQEPFQLSLDLDALVPR